jgi:hypothetical protein
MSLWTPIGKSSFPGVLSVPGERDCPRRLAKSSWRASGLLGFVQQRGLLQRAEGFAMGELSTLHSQAVVQGEPQSELAALEDEFQGGGGCSAHPERLQILGLQFCTVAS